ncbi:MAG: hypothetical protein H8E55_38250 [Pelagibacterales bacterium]|nr:hypothetical protein [Pelagibacterales bacterium]
MNRKDFRFKDVDLTFNLKKLPFYDQEYLRTMVFETIGDRSVKQSGIPFNDYFPAAANFTLFNNEATLINYMSEFYGEIGQTTSHLLHGKKYWLAWNYYKQ